MISGGWRKLYVAQRRGRQALKPYLSDFWSIRDHIVDPVPKCICSRASRWCTTHDSVTQCDSWDLRDATRKRRPRDRMPRPDQQRVRLLRAEPCRKRKPTDKVYRPAGSEARDGQPAFTSALTHRPAGTCNHDFMLPLFQSARKRKEKLLSSAPDMSGALDHKLHNGWGCRDSSQGESRPSRGN